MENIAGLDGRRLSKGPNEGASITSGLGNLAIGTAGNASGTSDAQTKNISDRESAGINASHQNTSINTASGSHSVRDAAVVGTGGAMAEGVSGQGSHLRRQIRRGNLGSDVGYKTPSTDPSSKYNQELDTTEVGAPHHYRENGSGDLDSNVGHAGSIPRASGAYTGPYGTAIPGPHLVNAANLLDPNVNTTGKGHIEDSHYHSRSRGGGGESADKFHRARKKSVSGAGLTAAQSFKKVKYQGSGVESTSTHCGSDAKKGHVKTDSGISGITSSNTKGLLPSKTAGIPQQNDIVSQHNDGISQHKDGSQRQYERDSTTTSGMGCPQDTSRQQYRTLSSGTTSGVESIQIRSNAPRQIANMDHILS